MSESTSSGFDQVFGADGTSPLRFRKPLAQQATFWAVNLLVMPLAAVCVLVISASGLRELMSVTAFRIYKLPIPGAGQLKLLDGWDRLDLAMLCSILIFGATTYALYRLMRELMGSGDFIQTRTTNPILFYLVIVSLVILIGCDALLFYWGLALKASSGWNQTSALVPVIATTAYLSGVSLFAAWHADYHNSGKV